MKVLRFTLVVAALTLNTWMTSALAAPAAPIIITLTQPSGATFEAQPRGDEYRNWTETLDGYTVVKSKGTWFYALHDPTGNLVPSPHRVGATAPGLLRSIPKGLKPAADSHERVYAPRRTLKTDSTTRFATSPHTQPVLVILLQFANITMDDYTPATAQSAFADLMFGVSDSVAEYYDEISYGAFEIVPATETDGTANDGIITVTLGTNHPNVQFAVDAQILAAFDAADPFINYATYDTNADGHLDPEELSVVVIFAGYENSFGGDDSKTPRVWGHMSATSSDYTSDDSSKTLSWYTAFGERHATTFSAEDRIATIGIMCHELGHLMFGLPDLYDTDQSSEGIGDWGLMGGGSWNGLALAGDTPAHMSAWSKYKTGMITPTSITTNTVATTFMSAAANADAKFLWLDKYKVREAFLLENRQLTGYDAALPGSGLMIWHIDDSKSSNTNDAARIVDLEEADGLNDLDNNTDRGDAGDAYPGSTNNTTFNGASNPNSNDNSNAATGVAVASISSSMATMTADLTPSTTGGTGDHIRYETGESNSGYGYGNSTVWTALRITNDTSGDLLEGFEVATAGSATVDFSLYESLNGTTPTTLLHSQNGFASSPGWNRFLLTTPQSFPVASTRIMVLKIVDASAGGFPARIDYYAPDAGRSYLDANGVGPFQLLTQNFSQVALLGTSTPINVAPVITGQSPIAIDMNDSYTIVLEDLTVDDSDNSYPADFSLTVGTGDNYSVNGAQVTPDTDFVGLLTVPVTVNDGVDDSNTFDFEITVNAVTAATVYVDFADVSAPFVGTEANPYNDLDAALAGVQDPGAIVFSAGSSSWTGTIDQGLSLEAPNGAVSIGAP